MKRLKVLFLPHPIKELASPWNDDLIAAVSARHEISVFDEEAPLAPQFEGVNAVIDHGGAAGTRRSKSTSHCPAGARPPGPRAASAAIRSLACSSIRTVAIM